MRKLYEKYKCFWMSVFVWGILAHGTVLFNKIGFFDEMLYMFNVGATYTSGRWMLGITSEITRFLIGGVRTTVCRYLTGQPLFCG